MIRWNARRKLVLMERISSGELTMQQAREQYALSEEELAGWQRDYELRGKVGLMPTKSQDRWSA